MKTGFWVQDNTFVAIYTAENPQEKEMLEKFLLLFGELKEASHT